MSAAVALCLIDVLFVAACWPLSVWLLSEGTGNPQSWALAAIFAAVNLVCLYALGLYRRESIADFAEAVRRIPMVVGIAIAASILVSGLLGWRLSPSLCVSAAICFAGCMIFARMTFVALRRHSLFRTRLLVIGAGERAWDLVWILRSQGRHWQYDLTFVHEDSFGTIDPRLAGDPSNRIILASRNLLKVAEKARADQIVVAPDERRGASCLFPIGPPSRPAWSARRPPDPAAWPTRCARSRWPGTSPGGCWRWRRTPT